MAGIANDIQQLEALESDLRKKESYPQEIKELEKKIEERKEYISSICAPKGPSKSELESKMKSEIEEIETKSITIFEMILFLIFVLSVIAAVVSYFCNYTLKPALITGACCFAIYIIYAYSPMFAKKEAKEKELKEEIKFQYQEKLAEIEKNELRSKNSIARENANDTVIKQYYQEIAHINDSLPSIQMSINENNILSVGDKNLSTVSFVLNQLKTGRADSIKEALQRYDDKRERDSIREVERMEREWEREKEQKAAAEREEQARRERELQRRRQEEIDRENKELRDRINKALDDLEDR